jgi:hypothetical protein
MGSYDSSLKKSNDCGAAIRRLSLVSLLLQFRSHCAAPRLSLGSKAKENYMRKELAEMKGLIDAARAGQLSARNEFARRLNALGFDSLNNLVFPHPSFEEGRKIRISVSCFYGGSNASLDLRFLIEACKEVPHVCDEDCDRDCEQTIDLVERQPATAREVVAALAKSLENTLGDEEAEEIRDWELAKSLPTEEELAKVRRQIEDRLRKNPREIPAVAKLLKLL